MPFFAAPKPVRHQATQDSKPNIALTVSPSRKEKEVLESKANISTCRKLARSRLFNIERWKARLKLAPSNGRPMVGMPYLSSKKINRATFQRLAIRLALMLASRPLRRFRQAKILRIQNTWGKPKSD